MWTKEQIDTLVKMWLKVPCSEIAAMVGKSRNSVIGKAHRLKLRAKPRLLRKIASAQFSRLPEKRTNQCAEPGCINNVFRGSYCEEHSAVYYVSSKHVSEKIA